MLDPSIRLVDFEPGNAQLCKNRDSGVGEGGGGQNTLGFGPGGCC
jgi:hypothetical protein